MVKDLNKYKKAGISKDEQMILIEKLLVENKRNTAINEELSLKNTELFTAKNSIEEKLLLVKKENETLLLRQEQLEAQLYLLKEHIYGSKSEKTNLLIQMINN
jgi:hypothetical protein